MALVLLGGKFNLFGSQPHYVSINIPAAFSKFHAHEYQQHAILSLRDMLNKCLPVVVALIPDLTIYVSPVHLAEVELGMTPGHEFQPTPQTLNNLI